MILGSRTRPMYDAAIRLPGSYGLLEISQRSRALWFATEKDLLLHTCCYKESSFVVYKALCSCGREERFAFVLRVKYKASKN
jgi:hypothetical protein